MSHVADKLHPWVSSAGAPAGPRWLQDLRARGAATFSALGFPTVRDEEWRFTSVAPIANGEFRPAPPVSWTPAEIDGLPYGGASVRLVVVNGRFSPELSRLFQLPHGVRAGSLAAAVTGALHADLEAPRRYLGTLADFHDRAFVALNTAHLEDGVCVLIPDGVVMDEPIQLVFVSSGSAADAATVSYPRCLIVAGERSQARIVETYVGGGVPYLVNAVTEVFAGANASLDHYKVQQ